MHPQISQHEPGLCPICGMEFIPASQSDQGLNLKQIQMTDNAMALANVQTAKVGASASQENGWVVSGKILVNPNQSASMPAHFNGRVEKLFVTFVGLSIQAGEAVAQVYSPELIAAQQELLTAYQLRDSQPDLFKAVKNKFKNWKIHDSQIQTILNSGEIKSVITIRAHASGVVTELNIKEGDHIQKGKPILKVANLSTVWAEFDLYENQISNFQKGDSLTISAQAIPEKDFDAILSFIEPVLNTETRTVKIRAELQNKEGLLKPGMFVKATLESTKGKVEDALFIPKTAVLWTGERSVVYVKPNPEEAIFEMRNIKIGSEQGNSYRVLGGLQAGDEVVVNGTFTVDAATQLQGKNSMMHQEKPQEGKKDQIMLLPTDFQLKFHSVLNSYLTIKDALVASNLTQVQALAQESLTILQAISVANLESSLREYYSEIIKTWQTMTETQSLEQQRIFFAVLSEKMIAISVNLDNFEEPIFIEHCPMAKEGGANWLSQSKEIRNPYFGSEMLTCREVVGILKAKK